MQGRIPIKDLKKRGSVDNHYGQIANCGLLKKPTGGF